MASAKFHYAGPSGFKTASVVEVTACEVDVTASEVTNQHPGTWYSVISV